MSTNREVVHGLVQPLLTAWGPKEPGLADPSQQMDDLDVDYDDLQAMMPELNAADLPSLEEIAQDLLPLSAKDAASSRAEKTCFGSLLSAGSARCTPTFVAGQGHFKNKVCRESLER
jgi:hypothetical protein